MCCISGHSEEKQPCQGKCWCLPHQAEANLILHSAQKVAASLSGFCKPKICLLF